MAAPIFSFCTSLQVQPKSCWVHDVRTAKETNHKIALVTKACDSVAFSMLLVNGILGALSVIALPITASYAMIGVGAAGILTYIGLIIWSLCLGSDS